MNALILSDKEFHNKIYEELIVAVTDCLNSKDFMSEEYPIGRGELAYCMGCFGCWVKKPGECVIGDSMAVINDKFNNSDVAVYLCPVVFGQFSANMKNALDRWLPNVLPFFEVRSDGSTIHPGRYTKNPKQVFIAYAEDLSEENACLFTDIILKHRRNVEVIIYRNNPSELTKILNEIELKKVGAKL